MWLCKCTLPYGWVNFARPVKCWLRNITRKTWLNAIIFSVARLSNLYILSFHCYSSPFFGICSLNHFILPPHIRNVVGHRKNIACTTNIQYSWWNTGKFLRRRNASKCSPLGWPWNQGISAAFFLVQLGNLWIQLGGMKIKQQGDENMSTGGRSVWIRFILRLSGCAHYKSTKIVHVLSALIVMCEIMITALRSLEIRTFLFIHIVSILSWRIIIMK